MKITKIILLLLCVAVCFCSCSKTDDTNVTQTEYDELYNKYTALLDNAESDAQNLAALQQQHNELFARYNALLADSEKDGESLAMLQQQYDELLARYNALLAESEEDGESLAALRQQYDELLARYNALLADSEKDGESLAMLQQQYDELYAKYYDKMQMSADTGFDFESIDDFYLKARQYINMGRDSWLNDKYIKIPISQNNIEGIVVTHYGNEIFSNFFHSKLYDTSSNTTSSFVNLSLSVALNDFDITTLNEGETIYIVGSINNVDYMFSSSGEGYISVTLIDCFILEVE